MNWIVKTAEFLARRQWSKWEALTADPGAAQKTLLLDIVRRNRSTVFGKDHRFDSIQTPADYRRQVAIGDYERLRTYIERAASGEANILTAQPVLMFTMTSGSTGAPKLIPVTEVNRANHRRLTQLWYYRAYLDHPRLFNGQLLGVVSPAEEGRTKGDIPYGAASGMIHQSSPLWIQNRFAVPYQVAQVKDFAAKYYLTMRLAVEHGISFIGTPNPSTILRLVETADRQKEAIIRDIRDRAISADYEISATIRQAIVSQLRKKPARAAELERFVEHVGALRPRDYWPDLALIGCWKGGSVGVRLKEFTDWFGESVPVRDLGYMASEAQITLPIGDRGSAGILDIAANYYEFIPESEIDSANPVTLTCERLERERTYYLILTTPAGLYRYDINDLVRVADFHKRTPVIEFVRKGRDVTNITGEKLHVNQVIGAMEQAQQQVEFAPRHYRVSADIVQSRYLISVEFDGGEPARESLERMLQTLEDHLCQLNLEYEQKRRSDRLRAPLLQVMKPGWFERKTRQVVERGMRDTQLKAQLLSSELEDSREVALIVDCPSPIDKV
jgi:hypothetical protein